MTSDGTATWIRDFLMRRSPELPDGRALYSSVACGLPQRLIHPPPPFDLRDNRQWRLDDLACGHPQYLKASGRSAIIDSLAYAHLSDASSSGENEKNDSSPRPTMSMWKRMTSDHGMLLPASRKR